jgi:glyoxylase-like metal-dependent hydrolase (beta-lactamase superfamily II)
MQDDKGGYRQINKSLNICAFDDYLKGQTARLPQLANVEQLTPRVLRVLGQNPGKVNTSPCPTPNPGKVSVADTSAQFTFQGTNTYIVGTGHHRIIVDTSGGEPAWAELIASTLKSMDISLSHVLLTHWHGDHTGGVPDLLRLYPHLKDSIYKNEPDKGQQNITDGQIFRVEGATVRALHVPGHSEDHMCFILEEEQAMFTGDNILGHGTSAVEDLGTFMASLQKMHAQNCAIGYSAHGATITNLPAKIAGELGQKWRRERQVMQALGRVRSRGEKSVTVKDLVTEIYGESLDEGTRTLALEPFIGEVLRKLADDSKVAFEMRGGKRKWYSVEAVQQTATRRFSEVKTSSVVNAQVQAIST